MKSILSILCALAFLLLPNSSALAYFPGFGQSTVVSIDHFPGIDCSATTDSSAALNTLFNASNINGKHIRLITTSGKPCRMVVYQQIQIMNATEFWLDGDSQSQGTGVTISGCGTPTSPLGGENALIYVDRSLHWRITHIAIEVDGGSKCSSASAFTTGIQRDNNGVGGFTNTDSVIENLSIFSSFSGTPITNFIGIIDTSPANGENFRIRDTTINCQNSTGSVAIEYTGSFADDGEVHHDILNLCYRGVVSGGSQIRVEDTHSEGIGANSVFGSGGAFFYLLACSFGFDEITVTGNETDNGGPLVSNNTDGVSGCGPGVLRVESNEIGASDMAANTPAINVGNVNGTFIVTGNILKNSNLPTFPMIGSFNVNPNNGALIAYGNRRNGDSGPVYMNGSVWGLGSGLAAPQNGDTEGLWTSQATSNDYTFIPDNVGHFGWDGRSAALIFEAQQNYTPNDVYLFNYMAQQSTTYAGTLVIDAFEQGIDSIASTAPFTGQLAVVPLNTAPSVSGDSVSPQGTTGSTTWTYKVVGLGGNGCSTAASSAVTTTTGNATLNGTNFNQFTIITNDFGIVEYEVFRTASGGSPSTTGIIGFVPVVNSSTKRPPLTGSGFGGSGLGSRIKFNDTGLVGDSTTPPTTSTCNGMLTASLVNMTPVAIASLPVCNAAVANSFSVVNNGATSPTYGGTVSATGAVTTPVFCDGSNWTYH